MPVLTEDAEAARLAELRTHVRAGAEDRPGVYRMLTDTGEVAYVGKSKRVRTRLLSYFRASYPEDKAARILRTADRIDWSYEPSEFAALLQELHLIKLLRPRLNVSLKRDARNFCFVKMTTGRAPRLTVSRGNGSAESGSVFFGPFSGASHLREAIRELSIVLGLRDCTLDSRMRFSDQIDLIPAPPRTPGCIRFEIGSCLGPCVAATTERAYSDRVSEAQAFLSGDSDGPIVRLETAMRQASDSMAYERAAILRDKLRRIETLQERFSRLRFAVETLTFVYVVPGWGGDDRFYLIRRGVVRDVFTSPTTPEAWAVAMQRMQSVFGETTRELQPVPAHEIDELLLLTSWFSTRPEELDSTLPPATLLQSFNGSITAC